MYLIVGGLIKFCQIVQTMVPFFSDKFEQLDKEMRDAFLAKYADSIVDSMVEFIDDTSDSKEDFDSAKGKSNFQQINEFFSENNITDNKIKSQYIMAYVLRKDKIPNEQTNSFLTNLREQPALLDAAQDEFIVLKNNNPFRSIPTLLSDLMANKTEVKKTELVENNVEFRKKAANAILKNDKNLGFFTPKRLGGDAGRVVNARQPL